MNAMNAAAAAAAAAAASLQGLRNLLTQHKYRLRYDRRKKGSNPCWFYYGVVFVPSEVESIN
jgi:hypothetical protein